MPFSFRRRKDQEQNKSSSLRPPLLSSKSNSSLATHSLLTSPSACAASSNSYGSLLTTTATTSNNKSSSFLSWLKTAKKKNPASSSASAALQLLNHNNPPQDSESTKASPIQTQSTNFQPKTITNDDEDRGVHRLLLSVLQSPDCHLNPIGITRDSEMKPQPSSSLSPRNASSGSTDEHGSPSPRLVISNPNNNNEDLEVVEHDDVAKWDNSYVDDENYYYGVADDIISDSDRSEVYCFSPSNRGEIEQEKPSSGIVSPIYQDPEMNEFDEWFQKFEFVGADDNEILSGTVDLNTIKKNLRTKSLSKFVSAMSEPFVHTGSSSKFKVKTLSPRINSKEATNTASTTTKPSYEISASGTGGALKINETDEQEKHNVFGKSFKNIVLGRKTPGQSPTHNTTPIEKPPVIIQNSLLLTYLPTEIKFYILQFLEFTQLQGVRLVCQKLKDIADDNIFWEDLCKGLFVKY